MDSSRPALASFDAPVRAIRPDAAGLGIARPCGDAALVTTRHRAGTSSYLFPLAVLPETVRRLLDGSMTAPAEWPITEPGPFAARLRQFGVTRLVGVPLGDRHGAVWF